MGKLKAWNMEMNSQVNKRHFHPILQKMEYLQQELVKTKQELEQQCAMQKGMEI